MYEVIDQLNPKLRILSKTNKTKNLGRSHKKSNNQLEFHRTSPFFLSDY